MERKKTKWPLLLFSRRERELFTIFTRPPGGLSPSEPLTIWRPYWEIIAACHHRRYHTPGNKGGGRKRDAHWIMVHPASDLPETRRAWAWSSGSVSFGLCFGSPLFGWRFRGGSDESAVRYVQSCASCQYGLDFNEQVKQSGRPKELLGKCMVMGRNRIPLLTKCGAQMA